VSTRWHSNRRSSGLIAGPREPVRGIGVAARAGSSSRGVEPTQPNRPFESPSSEPAGDPGRARSTSSSRRDRDAYPAFEEGAQRIAQTWPRDSAHDRTRFSQSPGPEVRDGAKPSGTCESSRRGLCIHTGSPQRQRDPSRRSQWNPTRPAGAPRRGRDQRRSTRTLRYGHRPSRKEVIERRSGNVERPRARSHAHCTVGAEAHHRAGTESRRSALGRRSPRNAARGYHWPAHCPR